ncbi:MAG: RNA 2',3'-cyclic phosphodiesterase [Clostridia bacterium]|nr:RNA 2',3'-cyclic phosphodiesterase [Clostridia bacterium]
MRTFIAIELPRSMKSQLASILSEVKQMSTGGRFVPNDSFHITLHFLGDTDDIVSAALAMREAVRGIRNFNLHLGKYSSFEKNGSHTAYIDVKGDTNELNVLHEALESALAQYGFPREVKRFTPHITLGRNVTYDELVKGELEKTISPNASMLVSSITLFQSERIGGKMVYTPLHTEKF